MLYCAENEHYHYNSTPSIIKFFEEAAQAGNALAQANAGAFHFMGRGTSKNFEKAGSEIYYEFHNDYIMNH